MHQLIQAGGGGGREFIEFGRTTTCSLQKPVCTPAHAARSAVPRRVEEMQATG